MLQSNQITIKFGTAEARRLNWAWVSQHQHDLTDLNSNNKKNYRVTPLIESLQTTQIGFFRFAAPCGFFRGSGDAVQKVSVQGFVQEKIIWNHLSEHCFSVPDPRVFPPPGDHFSTPTTEFMTGPHRQPSNQDYNLFVCTVCPCLTSFLKWKWDKPLRNSRSLDMTRVTWKSRLRLDCVNT